MAEITQDIFERDVLLSDLKRTLEISVYDEEQFRARTKDLSSYQHKFTKLQSKIEKLQIKTNTFDREEQLQIRNQFSEVYFSIISTLNKLKRVDEDSRRLSRVGLANSSFVQSSNYLSAKLPKLPLPSFSGDSTDWPSYYDLFLSLVHNNHNYTDSEKFRYLLLTLKNEPFNLIKSIPITEENYSVAFDILIARYENKRIIASTYIDRILDLDVCSDKSQSIRNLLNVYQENIKALEMMKFPVNEWDFLLLNILLRKISPSTRKRFELSLAKPSDIPNNNLLVAFLEKEITACEITYSALSKGNSYEKAGSSKISRNRSGEYMGAFGSNTLVKRSLAANVTQPNVTRVQVRTPSTTAEIPTNSMTPIFTKSTSKKYVCVCCNDQHQLTKCSKFLSLDPKTRYNFIKNKNVCFNCLNVGHDVKNCFSKFACRVCHKKHHSLIHLESIIASVVCSEEDPNMSVSFTPEESSAAASGSVVSVSHVHAYRSNSADPVQTNMVLLATALVDIYITDIKLSTVRCLIDTGSQASFITEACAQRLRLKRKYVNVPIYGIGDHQPIHPKGLVSLKIAPRFEKVPMFSVDLLILPKLISDMPRLKLPTKSWSHINNLKLADPCFHTPHPVEMILGADVIPQLLLGGVIPGIPGSPSAMNSVLGYILFGKIECVPDTTSTSIQVCCSSFSVDESLRRFWELESVPEKKILTPKEQECESIYASSVKRDFDGRYIVALPFRSDAPSLGESRDIAQARLFKLERRLKFNQQLKTDYHACLQEYIELNHMERIESSDDSDSKPVYYIPHHCVVKESSETTKTRVVFDAGCKSSNGVSLNDMLLVGPKLHHDIVNILLKFRMHAIVFTADIKQMYRNILVRESDRDFQRILWRSSPDEPVGDYRLRTVTFGVSSSPFLALRTIQQLAYDEAARFPLASKILQSDVFVDDIISGGPDIQSALIIQKEILDICQVAGFELRKWHSNSPTLLAAVQGSGVISDERFIPHGERTAEPHSGRLGTVVFPSIDNDTNTKVLGLQWNPATDMFNFSVSTSSVKVTKRSILSEIAKIYDPMGWVSPVTIYAKLLIQILWIAGVSWDEPVPVHISDSWLNFIKELPQLCKFTIPRHAFPVASSIQFHGFSDASEKAYAACVYVRVATKNDFQTFLLLAKTRVAPISPCLSIPRLELMGSVLLSNLMELVISTYKDLFFCEHVFAWTDSTIVLSWLRSPPYEWKTFVSNRTSEILSRLPANCWNHVSSADNPADAPSRGMLPGIFLKNETWLHGPKWLSQCQDNWPSYVEVARTNLEKRNLQTSIIANPSSLQNPYLNEIIERFSSLNKLIRVISYIFRFYNNLKEKTLRYTAYITCQEYNFTLNRLIYLIQQFTFREEINKIINNKIPSVQFKRLGVFIDKQNCLRIGGRIHKSLLPYETKHQLVLPKKHPLVNLIIDNAHCINLHSGYQLTHYFLLQKYWILSGRDIIRQRIHRCVRCFRARPLASQPRMAPLPAARIKPDRPFIRTAIDYAGPFYVRANKVRNAKVIKCYVAVFVCMSVKAVHLEMVSELSTDAFLAALRRFIARRGLCKDIYSDCGRNFVGCNNYLRELYNFLRNDKVQASLNLSSLQQGITWHFQPPYASHFGGLFEAGVKSFKHHLYRVVGTRTQTYDEMHTLLCQIEAVLNSRPLCALSTDATDPLPLTPSHFLIGEPLTALPDVSLLDYNASRLTRWRWIQQCVQCFWKRWSTEYLHELQQRNKWFRNIGVSVREGMIVVVRDDNLPPLHWKLARVHKLHPGSDGVTRVVTLQSGESLFKRSVVKICPLPIESA